MRNYRKYALLALLFSGIALAACEKQNLKGEDEKPDDALKTAEVNVLKWGDWVYFNFKEQKVVEVSDPKNDKGWDIAFHLTDFKTNGGASTACGALGAAAKTDAETLSASAKFDGVVWVADETGVGIIKKMQTEPDKSEPKNLCLSDKVIQFNMTSMPPAVEKSGKVWLVKDAQGKVVALKVKSCEYEGVSGSRKLILNLEYVYLAEGSITNESNAGPSIPSEPKKERKVVAGEVNVLKWDAWTYFNFKGQKVVEVSDPKNDKGWDIAFHITDFKTNGGASTACGAKGAAAMTNAEELKANATFDGAEWVTDVTGVGIRKSMMGAVDKDEPKNLSLSDKIIKFNMGSMPPAIERSAKVWLVKDAEGKVVAFRAVSCDYAGAAGSRQMVLKFEYIYLED